MFRPYKKREDRFTMTVQSICGKSGLIGPIFSLKKNGFRVLSPLEADDALLTSACTL